MKATLKVILRDGQGRSEMEAGFEFDLANRDDFERYMQMRERIESSESVASSPKQFFYQIQHALPKHD